MSLHKSHQLLSGPELVAALISTKTPVRWIRDGSPIRSISPQMAVLIARAGSYKGKARTGRVYYIREVEVRRIENDPKYWSERACIRFHEDQVTEIPQHRTKRRAQIWDRVLNSNPKRWS